MLLNVNDNLVRATVKLWAQVVEFQYPTDALLSKFFRENRKLGIKERNVLAETIYTILRHYNKLSKIINPNNSFTLIGYVWLKLLNVDRNQIRALKTINLGELDKLPELDMATLELPEWVIAKLRTNFSDNEISKLSEVLTKEAPLTLRVNILKTSRDQVLEQLLQQEIVAKPTKYSPYGITLGSKRALLKNELFLNGLVEVQDESSQIAGMLLGVKRGEMVADFCAGSGGKTLLLGMLMRNSGRIYAFDVNERRLGNLTPRLARSGLSNIFPQLIANENDNKIKRLSGKMDRVFVDAPCMGLGTIRRNPDLKFRQREEDLAEITIKQAAILNSASRLVKSGGRLVYATCSILKEENQEIIKSFLENNPEFTLIANDKLAAELGLTLKDGNYLELFPHIHDSDGFFASVLEKNF